MEDIELTEAQVTDLFHALISSSPEDSVNEFEIELQDYLYHLDEESNCHCLMIHFVHCDPQGVVKIAYDLSIGYLNQTTGQPVEKLELLKIDLDKAVGYLLPLGRVGYVTDKLREYGVWGRAGKPSADKPKKQLSYTGWHVNEA